MNYKVKDVLELPKYGFKLEEIYDGGDSEDDEPLMGYTYTVLDNGFEKFWIEVPVDDVDENGKATDAVPIVYLYRSSGYALEDGDWEYYLPKLVELFNAGVLEVEK